MFIIARISGSFSPSGPSFSYMFTELNKSSIQNMDIVSTCNINWGIGNCVSVTTHELVEDLPVREEYVYGTLFEIGKGNITGN